MAGLNDKLRHFHGLGPGGSTLWVDGTDLLAWRGPFTGIPRTISSLLRAWLAEPGSGVRVCRFDADAHAFVEVPRAVIGGLLSAASEGALLGRYAAQPSRMSAAGLKCIARDFLRPAFHKLPEELQNACRDFWAGAKHLGWFLADCTAKLVRSTCGPRRVVRAPFGRSDWLLVSSGWDHTGYCTALARARKTSGLKIVPLVCDVFPCRLPHLFRPELPPRFARWAQRTLRLASRVLTISECSGRDIESLMAEWRLRPRPVHAIRLGVELGALAPQRPVALADDWEGKPFVLCVGTLEVRKNHALAYQAWRRLVETHGELVPPLVLAGGKGWLTGDLRRQLRRDPVIRGRIVHLDGVTEAELAWLYRNCRFTLYPSLAEGWGLPVAECLAQGKYCIASDVAALTELAGELIDYHDPLDLPGCLALLERALFEKEFLAGREERIRREYRPPGWESCAASIRTILAGRGAGAWSRLS